MDQNNNLNNIFKSGMFNSTPQKENTPSPFVNSTINQNPFASTNVYQGGSQTQNTTGTPSFVQSSYFLPVKAQGSVFGSSSTNQPLNPTQTTPFGSIPSTTYNTPSTTYNTPSTTYNTPSTTYNTPSTTYNTPSTTYNTPSTTYNTPSTTYNTPSTTYNTPSTTYNTATPFGSTPTTSSYNPTTAPFGSTQTTSSYNPTTTPFGSTPTTSYTTPTTTPFGSTQTTSYTTPTTTPYGSTPTTSSYNTPTTSFNIPFGSGFQSSSLSIGALKNGTRDTPYQDTRIKDGVGTIEIKHINAMNEYTRKSNDELRQEDYNLGRKAITSGGLGSGFNTGGSVPSFNSSFALNKMAHSSQPSVIQQQSVFGSTPATYQTGNSVFSTQPSSTQSPFNSIPSTTPFSSQTRVSNTSAQQVQVPSFPTSSSPFGTNTNTVPTTNTNTTPFSTNANILPSTNTNINYTNQPSFNTQQSTIPNLSTNLSSNFGATSNLSSNFSVAPNLSTNFGVTTPNFNTTSYQTPTTINPTNINYEDPFLLQDIKFEKVEKKKIIPINRDIPKPIFSDTTKKPLINLQYRPPKITQKKKIYTEPAVEEARHLKEVDNLVIGFDGKGRIQYIDKVAGSEVNTRNIEDKIIFMKNEVFVSDPPGMGLNKKARVYVEGVYAFSKSQGDFIIGKVDKDPLKIIQERFVYGLKEDPNKKFVDYNYDTGLYVYDVNHF